MSRVNINIDEAVVTAIKEFKTDIGYGVDFYIEAQSSIGIVFLQVVLYDNEARSYCKYIHEGDYVRVTGDLKTKPYKKKDGTDALSLIIERPIVFSKMASGNSRPQLQQPSSEADNSTNEASFEPYAVSASAETALDDLDEFMTDEEIERVLEERRKKIQANNKDTAAIERKEDTTDISNSKKPTLSNPFEDELPF